MRTSLFALLLFLVAAVSCDKNGFNPQSFNGVYKGNWKNAAGVEGPASITVTVKEDGSFDLTLDFDGNYLGLGDPPPNPMSGTYDDNGARVKGTNALYGNCDVTISPKGDMNGIFTNVGMGIFPKLTYTGTITATAIDATYETFQQDGTSTISTLKLTK